MLVLSDHRDNPSDLGHYGREVKHDRAGGDSGFAGSLRLVPECSEPDECLRWYASDVGTVTSHKPLFHEYDVLAAVIQDTGRVDPSWAPTDNERITALHGSRPLLGTALPEEATTG